MSRRGNRYEVFDLFEALRNILVAKAALNKPSDVHNTILMNAMTYKLFSEGLFIEDLGDIFGLTIILDERVSDTHVWVMDGNDPGQVDLNDSTVYDFASYQRKGGA